MPLGVCAIGRIPGRLAIREVVGVGPIAVVRLLLIGDVLAVFVEGDGSDFAGKLDGPVLPVLIARPIPVLNPLASLLDSLVDRRCLNVMGDPAAGPVVDAILALCLYRDFCGLRPAGSSEA